MRLSKIHRRGLQLCLAALLLAVSVCSAEVKLPAIFGDHMVLQGDQKIPVWGSAAPGEKVTVTLGKVHATTKADAKGSWRVDLKSFKPGAEALTMTVAGSNTLTFSDVVIGDVWVASGQSNMEFTVKASNTGEAAIKSADNKLIRLFKVPHLTATTPQNDIASSGESYQGKWQVCSPEVLAPYSAVGYFFSRAIQQYTGQPVGLIDTNWGGTPAQAWTSYEGLQSSPVLSDYVQSYQNLIKHYDEALAAQPRLLEEFKTKHENWLKNDKPKNDAALAAWAKERDAAIAAGNPEPPGPKTVPEPRKPDPTGGPNQPTVLFNGMIASVIPYGIKGAIWYQGEANASPQGAPEYRTLFPAMIRSWRDKWGEGDFPFLFVQLADFRWPWGMLRESQLMTLSLPNTGMAVAADVGTLKNIHPPYKEIVGNRLALAAEHIAYGNKQQEYSGPIYKSFKVEGNAVRISFDHAAGLKSAMPPVSGPDMPEVTADRLVGFIVAGADQQWHPAEAKIDGETVVVTSPEVKEPVAVRFAWEPPSAVNLYNKADLPASPFRTDSW